MRSFGIACCHAFLALVFLALPLLAGGVPALLGFGLWALLGLLVHVRICRRGHGTLWFFMVVLGPMAFPLDYFSERTAGRYA